jgi:hypothetical protein
MFSGAVSEGGCAFKGGIGVIDMASFLRGFEVRLTELASGVSLAKPLFVSICTMTGTSVCVSLLSKAVWVKRLARCMGAGGNGMNKGL